MRHGHLFFIIYSLFISAALLSGCAADDGLTGVADKEPAAADPVGQPVLFTAGSEQAAATKAGVPYMALNGRFVCTMYYHAKSTDTPTSPYDVADASEGGTMTTAWLRVNDNYGNSVYWNNTYPDPYTPTLDDYGFDRSATMFYWQNRLPHAFLALADYNKLTTNVGAETRDGSQGRLKLYPYGDKATTVTVGEGDDAVEQEVYDQNVYDLTRGPLMTAMTDQPDPIRALTIMTPAGATQEANRVELYFRHQFSQIQVNLKGANDNSANIHPDQIEKVELLGVSTEGYVINHLKADGTVAASVGKEVNMGEFSDAVLDVNPWGTSFEMFDMATGATVDADGDGHDDRYAIGFLKSYNAIAFGMLRAIRITWHEGTDLEPGVIHESTFEVTKATAPTGDDGNPVDLINLKSNMKYVYDLELRRGTLAVIRTQILDWMQKEALVYNTDGTITN